MKKILYSSLVLGTMFLIPFLGQSQQYVTNGTASDIGNSCFRLTQAINSQAGSVWFQNKVTLNDNVKIEGTLYLGANDGGADGIAFVLQPVCNGIGGIGGGLGYFGISPSLAVEFDTWQNFSDPTGDHVALMKNGVVDHTTANNLQGPVVVSNLENGANHPFVIEWTAATNNIKVWLDNVLLIDYTNDIVTTIFSGNANVFWGFTAATGAANNLQSVCLTNVTFTEEGSYIATNPSCPGSNNGSIDFNPAGGVSPFTFVWSTGQATEDISGLIAGTYSVTVTDGNGCQSNYSIQLTDEVDVTNPTITCPATIAVNTDLGSCSANVTVPSIAVADNCDIICNTDDLDEYATGAISGQSPLWVPWSATSTSGLVSTDNFVSAPNSLKIAGGSNVDQLLLLGNQTAGKWTISFKMFIPAGKEGYINIQQFEVPAIQWQQQTFFGPTGTGNLQANGTNNAFTYAQDVWFEVKQEVDLDNDLTKFWVNGVLVKTWQYSKNSGGAQGTKQLGAINFFPANANNLYYVDDIAVCGPASAMGDYIARRYSKTYALGTTNVSVEITDLSGNPASCSFDVVVTDITPPVVLAQDISVTLANGSATITALDVTKESQWIGYINAFNLPAYTSGIYQSGVESVADLKTTIDANAGTVTLQPNFTKYASGDPEYVNGAIGNKLIQASSYVEETGLVGQFFAFTGFVASNTLVAGYDNYAFVRIFDQNFGLLYETRDPLVAGQEFKVLYDFTPANTVYVQYGFGVDGLNANPADEAALGSVVVNAIAKLGDDCGIASSSIDINSFDCSNIGPNPVVLTVTDVNGNSASAQAIVTVIGEIPSCAIVSVPTSNVFTGGNPNVLYLGYGAQSTTLSATSTGGSSFTYSWSGNTALLSNTNTANPVFTPTSAGSYTYTATTTNEFGCSSTCDITIDVVDAMCGKSNNPKVLVCHNGHTICISANAVPAHLGNHAGDYLGPCTSKSEIEGGELAFEAYPNPSTGVVQMDINLVSDADLLIEVMTVSGQVVHAEKFSEKAGHYVHSLDLGNLASGMYMIRLSSDAVLEMQRIQIQK